MNNCERPVPLKLKTHGLTHIGQVRAANQDSFLVDDTLGLYIVADGMGGHAGGEIASQMCIQSILGYLQEHVFGDQNWPPSEHPNGPIQRAMANAINHASTNIFEKALENPALKGMGTTATVALAVSDHAYVAHVGDSRAYVLREGFLYQITEDHSLVSQQLRAGLITEEEAKVHHLRNVITRSVGYQEHEDVDVYHVELDEGDKIVLCSDGLHGKISSIELAKEMVQKGLKATQSLIDLANDRGGEDNISVIIAECHRNET